MSAAALFLALALTASPPSATPVGGDSGRGEVVLRLDCRSSLGRREVTLFANGTVRLRDGAPAAERMSLGELGRRNATRYCDGSRRSTSRVAQVRNSASGDWVEKCELHLMLRCRPNGGCKLRALRQPRPVRSTDCGSRWNWERARPAGRSEEHLPRNYRPQIGDCLLRIDGTRSRGRGHQRREGLELVGPDVPLTLYLPTSELAFEFSAKVACRR